MLKILSYLALCFAICDAVLMLAVRNASAQVLILSSDVDSLKVNTELDEEGRLRVPDGKSVRILLPSGATKVIDGPTDRPVRELVDSKVRLKPLWDYIKAYVKANLTGRNSLNPAATRGPAAAAQEKLALEALLSWSTVPIPVKSDSSICILKDAPLTFARLGATPPPGSKPKEPVLKLAAAGRLGEAPIILRWRSLGEKASLPQNVNILIGTRYEATANFAKPSSFMLKTVERREIEGDRLMVTLFSNGCTEQIDALLASRGLGR